MGLAKRAMQEMEEEEELNEWLRNNVDLGVEQGDEEWEELKEKVLSGEVSMYDNSYWDKQDYEEELYWLSKEGRPFPVFVEQIKSINMALSHDTSTLILKMKFSYIVTLMESCLGDMLKGFVFNDKQFIVNALKGVKELKDMKLNLIEIYQTDNIINKSIFKVLSGYLYHNVEKVAQVYQSIVGKTLPVNCIEKVGDIVKIVSLRHDIVHRNGFDIEGNERELTVEIYSKAVQDVVGFVEAMHLYLESARPQPEEMDF